MITLLDLSSYLGIGAACAITINLLLGMLMSLRYSPVRLWPHRPVNVFLLHQWTAYIAIFFVVTHPLVLLFLKEHRFGLFDVLFPIHSYLQPTVNLLGAMALYLLLLVFVSSLLRRPLGRPLWRSLHYLVFPAAVLMFVHSILTDPDLRDGHPDLLDGAKVVLESAALLSIAATAVRVRLRHRGLRPAATSTAVRPASPPHSLEVS